MKLTDMAIKRAKPKEKSYTLADGNGLSLLVETNGSKGWRYRYQFTGKTKMISLGIYPVVTLTEARAKRDEARKQVANGINPSEARKAEKVASISQSENTFKNIALEWYEGRKDRWSVGYRDDMMDAFEKDVFPYIGDRPIADIKPMELLEVLSVMEKRGTTEKLKKVRQRCGEVWKYAIITGRAEYNPAPDLASAFVPHKREHYAHLSVSELPEFLSSIDKYMGSQIVRVALRILILTGVRPGELRKAEWSEINFDTGIWEIPAEKMKMRRPHIVPLSEQVIELLKQIHPISGSYQYIFPSRTDYRKHISDMALNTMIRRMGYSGRATGHGFRHTMSTILHEQGYNTAWIETQLAHVDKNSIRGTYNHAQYLDGRREMLQWYADYMDALERGENVVHGTFGKRA
ncbi:tyrosine-type recombinase/integrase [Xenorhabdus bovienii]|uniref:tyrosine-type recombinase/integrase n=1 Tax=Xenorhabdus bovienii TaxID=40576 RepID=UPI00237D1757|nr:integrase arm-type DNA-binding domain-containing protein [Xenorhabdus bovienii]MDE1484428.1 tyrosine-type recombinase/integrase [Xenorhabdus bovienii]MDE9443617.1 tyrosine-type recombinase/integrase [Xenorhabdus bovienii]